MYVCVYVAQKPFILYIYIYTHTHTYIYTHIYIQKMISRVVARCIDGCANAVEAARVDWSRASISRSTCEVARNSVLNLEEAVLALAVRDGGRADFACAIE
jgi:hypothetical protein